MPNKDLHKYFPLKHPSFEHSYTSNDSLHSSCFDRSHAKQTRYEFNLFRGAMETPRAIDAICTIVDSCPDIIFPGEEVPEVTKATSKFIQRYSPHKLSHIFKAIGCQMPLNQSLAEWIFTFLRQAPAEVAARVLGVDVDVFTGRRMYNSGFLILSRIQFHRLISASLFIHQFRKVRYCVDFRLALDFIEERRFFIVLLSGAPGTGKSTIASLIASAMSVNHILSTDSIRHSMRSTYSREQYPVLHCSTYECGDIVDPDHHMSDEERCLKGYLAQSELVGTQLMTVIASFVKSRASLIVEGVHLSIDLMMKIVQQFPNIVPFLIYIKKEDFHKQRFAVRAKYMTTDPSMNKYISNFAAIRSVQKSLSQGANQFLIPKIDNRNIDRSLETMHQTLFSYLKKLEGRPSMWDPETQQLTFLHSVWKRRKQKGTSKTKTLKSIRALKKVNDCEPPAVRSEELVEELLNSLPDVGKTVFDDLTGGTLQFLQNGAMILKREEHDDTEVLGTPAFMASPSPDVPDFPEELIKEEADVEDQVETETEDPAEVTLTDFIETTDSEFPDWRNLRRPKRE